MGLNAEHSWADAPIIGHLWEVNVDFFGFYLASFHFAVNRPSDCKDTKQIQDTQDKLKLPHVLRFDYYHWVLSSAQ